MKITKCDLCGKIIDDHTPGEVKIVPPSKYVAVRTEDGLVKVEWLKGDICSQCATDIIKKILANNPESTKLPKEDK